MIVDDSVVMRRLISDALSADPDITVVTTAPNGLLGVGKLKTTAIDAVVLDIEMPVMDGLQTVREIRKFNRRVPIIMFSTLTERGAHATLEALSSGASDYVTKPANMGSVNESREAVRTQLVPRILALAGRHRPVATRTSAATPAAARPQAVPARATPPGRPAANAARPKVLVIGSSTGGPEALMRVLPSLPANFPVPILLAQHMPPVFTRMLAERLERASALTVKESAGKEPLQPGTAYLAPGDWHLEVAATGRSGAQFQTSLSQAPPENFCRPSVDVLFRSAAKAFGGHVLAVVLTGMGSDGALGALDIVNAGGQVIAQDRETSVVWGMPGAVANKNLAGAILPLEQISAEIMRRVAGGTAAATQPLVPAIARPSA